MIDNFTQLKKLIENDDIENFIYFNFELEYDEIMEIMKLLKKSRYPNLWHALLFI